MEFGVGDHVYLKVSPMKGMKIDTSLHWTVSHT
jgi:hypothetical protein